MAIGVSGVNGAHAVSRVDRVLTGEHVHAPTPNQSMAVRIAQVEREKKARVPILLVVVSIRTLKFIIIPSAK